MTGNNTNNNNNGGGFDGGRDKNTEEERDSSREQLEEIRRLHAARFRDERALPLPPRNRHRQNNAPVPRNESTFSDSSGASNSARGREGGEGVRGGQNQQQRTGITNLIPGALNVGIAMAHARHALGRHLQQRHHEQQQQEEEEERRRGDDAPPPLENEYADVDMDGDDDEDEDLEDLEDEEDEEDDADIPDDEDILPKPSYLTDDHLLALECAKTGKAPEQLESEYKDEVLARKWQIKEARMEEKRQRRREERRLARQQQQEQEGSRVRRRDEVNERPGDSVRRRQTRIEIQVGGPNGPVFRSVMGGSGMMGMLGGNVGQEQQSDPFLEIMRQMLGQRAPGEAREDVLNDNDRFERAFRNMFQSVEQGSAAAMGAGAMPPRFAPGSVQSFGDLIRTMQQLAAQHANGRENLAEAPLTQQQIDAMETITAKGDENDGKCASCSVCLSDIEGGENMKRLSCGHCYHSPCIDTWLLRSRICPTCRHDSTKPPTAAASTEAGRRSDMD